MPAVTNCPIKASLFADAVWGVGAGFEPVEAPASLFAAIGLAIAEPMRLDVTMVEDKRKELRKRGICILTARGIVFLERGDLLNQEKDELQTKKPRTKRTQED